MFWLRGIVGAVIGGAVGYAGFFLLAQAGLYALILPGALVGLGCGLLIGGTSNTMGVICSLLALLLGIVIEWRFAPFVADDSFGYFVAHLHQLRTMTLVMIVLGAAFAYWFGRGRGPRPSASPSATAGG